LGATFFQVNGNPFLMGATTGPERQHAFSVQGAVIPWLVSPATWWVVSCLAGLRCSAVCPGPARALPVCPVDRRCSVGPRGAVVGATRPAKVELTQARVATTAAAPYTLILMLTLIMLLRTGSEWVMRIFF